MERMARKPRGRMTAYAFFVQTCREELKKENPDENVIFAAFSKKCAERWNTMSEKEKARFHEMEDQDKKRYDLEMQNYVPPKDVKVGRQRKRQHNKYPNALKRSLSAFIWFCNDERSKVKANNPEYTMGDIAMELGLRWAAADPETKSKFEALSEQDKDRCDRVQMTDADTDTVQSPAERDVNKQLEFDNDWSAELMAVYGELDIDKVNEDDSDESDLDEVNEDGDRNLFSDPESEWAHHSESDVKSDDQIKKERT